jgi:hypothetical protein
MKEMTLYQMNDVNGGSDVFLAVDLACAVAWSVPTFTAFCAGWGIGRVIGSFFKS